MTTPYISTGSALERHFACDASAALPRDHFTSVYTERGRAIHSFLQAIAELREASPGRPLDEYRALALATTDDEHRELMESLEVDGLDHHFNMAAEVAFAYDFENDTARELGRGAREYGDVKPTEIPCTLDVVGVRETDDGPIGFYCDYKSGFQNTKSITLRTQIDFGALCIARTYGCIRVEGQTANVREDFPPFVQRSAFEAFELDMFADRLREKARTWIALRAKFLDSGRLPPGGYEIGPWCDGCNSREYCTAQTSLIRRLTTPTPTTPSGVEIVDRMDAMTDEQLASLWDRIGAAQSAISMLKKRMLGLAGTRPVQLGVMPDGRVRWLGSIITPGKEKLDGESVYDAVAELHNDEVATAATKVVATKKGIDAAIKAIAPPRGKAAMLRALYAKLATIPGAIVKRPGVKIGEILLPAGDRPALVSRRDDEPDADDSSTELPEE